MTDKVGNIETERVASYYSQPWTNDAVPRYFYAKVNISIKLCIYNKITILFTIVIIIIVDYFHLDITTTSTIRTSHGNTTLNVKLF